MEELMILLMGGAAICGFILLAQVFVWVWELWDKHKERKARRFKTYQEPRRKEREDYWAA